MRSELFQNKLSCPFMMSPLMQRGSLNYCLAKLPLNFKRSPFGPQQNSRGMPGMNLRKSIFKELLVQSRVVLSYILRTNDVSSSAGGTQLAALHSADLVC
jgi:hypothetical protein